MSLHDEAQKRDRWARLRFAIIGPLLAAPPTSRGELRQTLQGLAKKNWTHPVTGVTIRFGFSTLERWYYAARKAQDPVAVLRRRKRCDSRTLAPAPHVFGPSDQGTISGPSKLDGATALRQSGGSGDRR